MSALLLSFTATFFFSILLLLVLIRAAPAFGLLDYPGGRKCHGDPTPLVGGLAIFIGAIPLISWQLLYESSQLWIWVGLLILIIFGLWDDKHESPYRQRFAAHLIAGLVMASLGGIVLYHLGDLLGLGVIWLGVLAIPMTMFAVASAINALNLCDGVDGLASGLALIPLSIMTGLSVQNGLWPQAMLGVTFSAGVLAFALFNYPFPWATSAKCFLGDTGSNILGFVIVWLMIDLSQIGVIDPITALFLLGFPLFDTAAVIVRRRLRGLPPMTPGRDHLHHILLDAGLSVRAVVFVIHCAALLFALIGVAFIVLELPEPLAFWFYLVCLLSYIFFTRSHSLAAAYVSAGLKPLMLKKDIQA